MHVSIQHPTHLHTGLDILWPNWGIENATLTLIERMSVESNGEPVYWERTARGRILMSEV
jgi:hypothetical protein